jgi:hypothetical protein
MARKDELGSAEGTGDRKYWTFSFYNHRDTVEHGHEYRNTHDFAHGYVCPCCE